MALASLAVVADLPSAWDTSPDAQEALNVASAAIRDAAGSAIGPLVGTISTEAPMRGTLVTLPIFVRSVSAVTLDGTTITDYRKVGNGVWRRCGWGCEPVEVKVTGTFGLPEVPADIVDLCVQLAVAWLEHRATGGGSTAGLQSVRIDDAAESYSAEAAGQVSPVFIPEVTRTWLRARFGGGAVTVETL